MRAAPPERGRRARRGEGERGPDVVPSPERVREPGGEAVASTVGVHDRAAERRRFVRALLAVGSLPRSTLVAVGRDDEPGTGIEITRPVALTRIPGASHERVELHPGLLENRKRARRRHEHARLPCRPHGLRVTADEIDGVGLRQLGPWKLVASAGDVFLSDDRDRALALGVHERETTALRLGDALRLHAYAVGGQLG